MIAGEQAVHGPSVRDDLRLARQDDVETVADVTLLDERGAGHEPRDVRQIGDLPQLLCDRPFEQGDGVEDRRELLVVALFVATAQAYPPHGRTRYAGGCRWDGIPSVAHGGRSGVSVQVRRGPQPLPLTLVLRQHGTLIRQGAIGDGLWLVESGALRVAIISDAGHELVIDVLGPGHGAGEAERRAIAGDRPSAPSMPTLPRRLGRAAADLLTTRAHRAAALAADLAWLDVRTRVTQRLEDLSQRFGRPVEGGRLILLPLTQDEVAALAGTTRESANRALRAWWPTATSASQRAADTSCALGS